MINRILFKIARRRAAQGSGGRIGAGVNAGTMEFLVLFPSFVYI